MAIGKRTSAELKARVIEEKLNNPDLSTREIEEIVDLPQTTVAKVIREDLAQVCSQSSRIAELIDANERIITAGAKKVALAMETMTPEDIRETKEMQVIVDTAIKQNRLIQWESTENVSIKVDEVEKKSDSELDTFIKSKLNK